MELDSLYCYAGHRSDGTHPIRIIRQLRGKVDFTGNHFYETTAFEDPELLSLAGRYYTGSLKELL